MCVYVWWEIEVSAEWELGLTGIYSVGAQKDVFLLYSVRNTSAGLSVITDTVIWCTLYVLLSTGHCWSSYACCRLGVGKKCHQLICRQ